MKARLSLLGLIIILSSCGEEKISKPRPHQYPKIEFPDRSTQNETPLDCPFTLEMPQYASIIQKKQQGNNRQKQSCWFDIRIELLKATIHCSYYDIDAENSYEKLVDDAYTMASKHNVKANFREELLIETSQGSKGIIFKIEGPVATPYQFFLSDSATHFLRGSLYFDRKIEIDSMGDIITFLQEDINKMVGSISWDN